VGMVDPDPRVSGVLAVYNGGVGAGGVEETLPPNE